MVLEKYSSFLEWVFLYDIDISTDSRDLKSRLKLSTFMMVHNPDPRIIYSNID